MKATKNGNNTATKKRRVWGISLRTGLLGLMTASVLLLGVACTRNDKEDGTVADSNVGSVTSSTTEKNTEKNTEKSTEKMTEKVTEQESILPGTTAPGTTPVPQTTDNAETSTSATPGTTSRFGGFARGGKG